MLQQENVTPTLLPRQKIHLRSPARPTTTTLSPVQPFTLDSPANSSPAASSGDDERSPATSTLSSSGEVNMNMSGGTPVTSPMAPNDHTSLCSSDLHANSLHKYTSAAATREDESPSILQLDDYVSSDEEKMWDDRGEGKSGGDMTDDDDDDDEAPSLESNQFNMLDQLRDMGFRETIARAATEACGDMSVAVQYACDHPIMRRRGGSSSGSANDNSRSTDYSSKMQDSPLIQSRSSRDHEVKSVRSWSIVLPTSPKRQPAAAAAASSSSSSSSSSTPNLPSSTSISSEETTRSSPSSYPHTERQQQLARKLLSIGFQNHDVNDAVKRCNSTPTAARFIMDGGVKGWERKTADIMFECAICMDDDLDETDMVTLDCDHRFCRGCVKYHLDALLGTHQIKEEEMLCPVPGCNSTISLPIIRDLLNKKDYDRLLELKLRKEYAACHKEVRTCPKCEFMVIIEEPIEEELIQEEEGKQEERKVEEGGGGKKYMGKGARRVEMRNRNKARLEKKKKKKKKKSSDEEKQKETIQTTQQAHRPKRSQASQDIQKMLDSLICLNTDCKHKFCGRCGLAPHQRQNDQDVSCEDYAAFCEANDASNDIFEEYLKENKMKRCPKCLLPAELKSGCNFIRCVCKSSYCYLCGRGLDESMHYSHYYKGPYGKRCYGGGKDKKGHVALPSCDNCKGKDCPSCSENLERMKKEKLNKIQAKRDRQKIGRPGIMGWINKKFGKK